MKLVALVLLLASPSFAGTYVFLADDTGPHVADTWIVPPPENGPPPWKIGTGCSPWYIEQWQNPHPITPSANVHSGCSQETSWGMANRSTRVCWGLPQGGGYVVEFSQAGGDLACSTPTNAVEYDLFFSENPYTHSEAVNSGPTLDKLKSLTLTAGVIYAYRAVSAKCGTQSAPWLDSTTVLVGIVLQTVGVSPTQTNFYQLILSSSYPGAMDTCGGSPWYYFDHNPYGVNDPLSTPCLTPGPRRQFNLDMLPRFKNVFAIGPASMDKNLAHWKMVGWYFGTLVYGNALVTTRWDGLSIIGKTYDVGGVFAH